MKHFVKIFVVVCWIVTMMSACSKQTIGPMADIRPDVPVLVQNAMDYRPEPTVSTSRAAGGNITINLAIPSGLGRTIKEITKVAANTTYSQIQGTATTGFYNTAPIAGSGTTATFTTTLADYVVKAAGVIPASNTELAKRFYFLLTLDDGTVLISEPVRVLVLD